MKLATALAERADIMKQLNGLQVRLENNAKVQEGENPAEDPEELLSELHALTSRLEELVTRINMTNSNTFCDGMSMTALLARRDSLRMEVSAMRKFINSASAKVERYSRSEIRIKSAVNVKELQKKADDLSKELRITDEKIQELNWLTELA